MSKRILIVEDDDSTVRVLQHALGENGYQVAAAPSGQLALGEVQMREPDVILLDLYLRGDMNGPEFLDSYRRSGGRARVIAISGATLSDPLTQDLHVDEFIGAIRHRSRRAIRQAVRLQLSSAHESRYVTGYIGS